MLVQFSRTHLYTWAERSTERVKCLAQKHNTMSPARFRTRTARYRVECTHQETTVPPQRGKEPFKIFRQNWSTLPLFLFLVNRKRWKDGFLNDASFQKILPSGFSPGVLYGLPKVHKSRSPCPFRPIVSAVNNYNYNPASYLIRICYAWVCEKHIQDGCTATTLSLLLKTRPYIWPCEHVLLIEPGTNLFHNSILQLISTNQFAVKNSFSFAAWTKSYNHNNEFRVLL